MSRRSHLLSAAAGATAVGLALYLTSARQSPAIGAVHGGPLLAPNPPGGKVSVAGIPSWDQLVRIEEGETFVVPEGQVMVLTGAITGNPTPGVMTYGRYEILINGIPKIGGQLVRTDWGGQDVFFWGYAVEEGAVVQIQDNSAAMSATILGYLVNT